MEEFFKHLEPTSVQITEASISHSAMRAYLKSNLSVVADFLTGSYRRSTMLRQSRDIDLLLILDTKYFNGYPGFVGYGKQANGPANLLDRVKRLLKDKYQETDIGRDGQAVRVEFRHVHIDVVPAFALTGGGYYIPSAPNNQWIITNPKAHIDAISKINASTNIKGKFVPMVKGIKYWNYSHQYGIRGFFLEMMARSIFTTTTASSYAEAFHRFFDWGTFYLDNNFLIEDPGTTANLMATFYPTPGARLLLRERLKHARDLADTAITANAQGDNKAAIAEWKKLFGTEFPTYG